MANYSPRYNAVVNLGGHLAKALDLAILFFSGWVAYAFYFSSFDINEERYSWAILVGVVFAAIIFPLFRMYSSWKGVGIGSIIYNALVSYVAWGISIILVLFVFKLSGKFPRGWLVLWGGGAFLLTSIARLGVFFIYRKIILKNKYGVVLVGEKEYCCEVMSALNKDKYSDFYISRILICDQSDSFGLENNFEIYNEDSLNKVSEEEIWICLPISKGDLVISIVKALDKETANIRFMPGMQELRLINHKISNFSGVRLLDISCSPMTPTKRVVKRIEDIAISLMILILISPAMFIIAIGVKLSSPGPIFYQQARVSWNNRVFGMLKFRSMAVNNEDVKVEWGNAAQKKVTLFGRFIRRTSFDEFPQFINVLKGDMSIVGPRPERDIFVEKFGEEIPGYMQKHMVKAGITGWAQVHGLRGDTSLKRRIEYDLWYIEHWSLWLDIKIIFMTFFKVISDKSAV